MNSIGTGPASAHSAAITPVGIPTAAVLGLLPTDLDLADSTPALEAPIEITHSGFNPNETVTVQIQSTPVLLATTIADGTGTIHASFAVPASVGTGPHTISTYGQASGHGSRVPVTVVATDDHVAVGTLVSFTALSPVRVFDTRTGQAQVAVTVEQRKYGGATILKVKAAGAAGVPTSGVGAVSLNVTVTSPAAPGYVTVFS